MMDDTSVKNWETFLELSKMPDINRDKLYKIEMQSWKTGENLGKIKVSNITKFTGQYRHTCIDGTPDLRYKNNAISVPLIRVQIWAYGKYFNMLFKHSKKNNSYISNLQNRININ